MKLVTLRRVVMNRMKRKNQSARGLLRDLGLAQGNTGDLVRFLRGDEPPRPVLLKALGYKRVQSERYVLDK